MGFDHGIWECAAEPCRTNVYVTSDVPEDVPEVSDTCECTHGGAAGAGTALDGPSNTPPRSALERPNPLGVGAILDGTLPSWSIIQH